MILELLLASAWAQEEPAEPEPVEDDDGDLEKYRTPFSVLVDRTIGTTSTPVEFNWRRTKVQVAAVGSLPIELNNFNSLRAGAVVRFPTSGLMAEIGLSGVEVWDTPSSDLLAFTPYRQPGRPARGEIDLGLGVPLAEGVVTAAPRWFPAVQLVFLGNVGLRYALYPTAFRGLRIGEVATAVLSPTLSQEEIDNLDRARLDAMLVDTGRYALYAGVSNDLYFKQGLFVTPRAVFSIPLLAPVTGTRIVWWADVSLSVGVAF